MLNKVTLIGYLGKDPSTNKTQSGVSVTSFSIATSEKYKDKQGETKESTEWHNIVAWQNLADICGKYLKKGSLVYVEGKLQTRSYQDKDGATKYTTEIVISEMKMLGGGSNNGSQQSVQTPTEPQTNVATPQTSPTMANVPTVPIADDDLPF
jgi:single-strand DNA-binding protein